MADNNSTSGKGTPGGTAGKRPYATLDLRATEIKVTPISTKTSQPPTPQPDLELPRETEVPLPAAARTYAAASSTNNDSHRETTMRPQPTKSDKSQGQSSAAASAAASAGPEPQVIVQKRGGFLSHLAAGIVGGALVFAASQWLLPELGLPNSSLQLADNTAALSNRIAALEKNSASPSATPDLSAIESRIAELEKAAQAIPAISDNQKRLVAETKAALASAASDAGSPQLIERLGKVEDKMKALADAGANDPNSGNVAHLAALTGKVSDLETSLATQLTALRTDVTKDIDARILASTEASQSARAGTDRIDKDVATLKTDQARIEARAIAAKDASDRVAADLKLAQEETAGLKTAFEALKTTAAKPTDISAAVAPISDRTALLEKSLQQVQQEDAARKQSAEHVVLALELQNLKRALDSGQKYAAELDAVKKVAGGQVDLSALTKLQDTGVPALADLTKDFRGAADKAIDADVEPENAGVVDRLWAGAKSVVRVRRIDVSPDDKTTEAIVSRMQVALNDGRLSDVLETAKELSPKAQDAARPFLDKLAARVSVDTALSGLENQLKTSIAAGAQPAAPTAP